jgi:LysR family transcriptional regulator (chromosome initiation inhibitor)
VSRAFGVRQPRLQGRYVPSSEAYLQAAEHGWGVGVLPVLQAGPALARGSLVALRPEVTVDVQLYWHQWRLGPVVAEPGARVALLDQIGAALAAGAADALNAGSAPGRRRSRRA